MKLLAIDTSSVACTVALHLGSSAFERHEEQAREHTRLLMPMIRDVLMEGRVELADLDAIVLGNGPGSFIGMRIAASVAQGLAHGAGLNIVPVSSLAAVAAQAFAETDANSVIVAQDAHMNEVYLCAYSRGDANIPDPMFPERLHGQVPVGELESADAMGRIAAGFGWQRYPAFAAANEALIESHSEILHPRARYLVPLGAIALQNGETVEPREILPAYLRNKVAEIPARGQS
ncbi:MAG: tRNA (adenosine(37)-N6)-threonylcarbamoyltransferase complex dimerization subunit type 1 TsaB [Gammaproteobacteria bacterium]|nr:tRNA (adenosine(37)-N6)-threonylcarbamoyltransferase complex dimerization subunit type 1 TsaB [Gammaproteobacteria bacterium]